MQRRAALQEARNRMVEAARTLDLECAHEARDQGKIDAARVRFDTACADFLKLLDDALGGAS